ncbi:hypothetical protein V2J09_015351 [Rumex salicifolius]
MLGFMKSPFNTRTRRASPEPILIASDMIDDSKNQFEYDANASKASKNSYKNDFKESGGLGNQSVQQLQQYAVHKAEESTSTVNNCLSIAVDMKEEAVNTLQIIHQQGEQIYRTHEMAVNLDRDLTKGEKLLGSLGGMFSKTWKPKKTRAITGPKITPEKPSKSATKEQREKLGITKPKQPGKTSFDEPTSCYKKIEMEKEKQDDVLDDLSSILGDLKGVAFEMGSELNRQSKALDHVNDDIDELNSRVKDAEKRARKLVAK